MSGLMLNKYEEKIKRSNSLDIIVQATFNTTFNFKMNFLYFIRKTKL